MSRILIVGAGPAGLMLAIQLLGRGIACRVIDGADGPCPWGRATDVQPSSLELLERLGMVDAVIAGGVKARGTAFYAGGQRLAFLSRDMADTRFPYMLFIPQPTLERRLSERVVALGGEVEWGTRLTALTQDDEKIRVELEHRAGRSEAEFDWLAGCDGLRSTVRQLLDIPFPGLDYGTVWSMGEAEIFEHALPRDEQSIFFGRGTLLFFPLPQNRFRFFYSHPARGEGAPTREEAQAVLQEEQVQGRLGELLEVNRFHVHSRHAAHYRRGRCFLLGDAAHVFSPAGGQGLNVGLADAENLGWKLALVVSGRASARLLDSYDDERRTAAEQADHISDEAEKYATLRDAEAVRRRDDAMRRGMTHAAEMQKAALTSQFLTHYRASTVVLGGSRRGRHLAWAGPAPGDRLPDSGPFRTHDGGLLDLHALFTHLDHTALLFLGDVTPPEAARQGRALCEAADGLDMRVWVVNTQGSEDEGVLYDADGWVHAQLGITEDTLLIVRPDGHLGLRGTGGAGDEIGRYRAQVMHS